MTVADAPWWGVPVLAGVFALIGVFVAQMVAYAIERGRREREDARRFDKEQREMYIRYINAARVIEDKLRGAAHFGEEYDERLFDDFADLSDEVEMLASLRVMRWANRLRDIAWNSVANGRPDDADLDRFSHRLGQLRDIVRHELGLQMLTVDSVDQLGFESKVDPNDGYYAPLGHRGDLPIYRESRSVGKLRALRKRLQRRRESTPG